MSLKYNVITLEKNDLRTYANSLDVTHISRGEMKKLAFILHNAIVGSGIIERTVRLCLQDLGIEVM
jgi:hypothetical protein